MRETFYGIHPVEQLSSWCAIDQDQSTLDWEVDQSCSSAIFCWSVWNSDIYDQVKTNMIKFVIVAALVGLVAGRNIEETKVNDKVAARSR